METRGVLAIVKLIILYVFINITLGFETQTDLKDKGQSLVIGSYLSLEPRDYKNFKCKVVMNTLRYIIPPSNIYRMSTQ